MAGEMPDYSILLQRPQGSSSGEAFSNLLGAGLQRQAQQQQMQQAAYQQQRQRSLADLVSQNANVYADPAARAYALGGFGEQAAQAQAAAIQRQQQAAALQESAVRLDNIHRDLTASRLATVKSQEDYDKVASSVPEEYGLKPGDTNWQDAVQTFRKSRITPEQEAENNKTRFKEDVYGRIYDTFTGQVSGDALGKTGGAGAAAGLPQAAIDVMVDKAVVDGDMPKFGSGALGMKQRADFLNRFAEKYPGQNMATAHAQYRANMHNLSEATSQGAVQEVKEDKAHADLQTMRATLKGLINTGSPLVNRIGRGFQEASGDPNYAAFRTAREMALPTINAAVNTGQMSVGAREEIKDLLKKDDSIASMEKAMEIIEKDMARSGEAARKRTSRARQSVSVPGKGQPSAADPHQAAADWARANPDDPDAKAVLAKALSQGAK